jgi:hypothetical protein
VKSTLEFILQHVAFLYLNPEYRITDSNSRGLADIDASMSFTGERLRWDVVNDRGQIYFAAVPILPGGAGNWFAVSLIRQYLEGGDDTGAASPAEQANWLSANLERLEELFADEPTSVRACDSLIALRRSNSSRKWQSSNPNQI